MKKMRFFSIAFLMGIILSADLNSENLPVPIPIDFGVDGGMRNDSTFCESCNISYDADTMGAACCDEATDFNSEFTCEVLETTYLWNCSGCDCTEDSSSWATDFGCTNDSACNYNAEAIWDDGSCSFTDDICQSCEDGEIANNDDDGDNVCNDQEIIGCQDEAACDYNPDATDSADCSYQSSYCEDADGDGLGSGDFGEYCLEDVPVGWVSDCTDSDPNCATNDTDECEICGGEGAVYGNYENCCEIDVDECGVCDGDGENIECWDGSMACNTSDCPDELTECIDDPDVCIWNTILNYNYNSQDECEINGGVWGGYLAYFGTSCNEVIDTDDGCDTVILYWSVSDLCPLSCGECCDDDSACNDGDTNNGCEYPEDFGACDCDGNVLDDCGACNGGNASMDDCGVCDGDNTSCADCCGVPNGAGDSCDGQCGPCNDEIYEDACDCDGNVLDDCGACNGGNASMDDCGVCDGDNTSCADCCGVPNGAGDSCDGQCGPCNDEIYEDACDCDGNVLDDCGACNGGNASMDDCGVCDGDNTSCADCCGVPNGAGDSCDGQCGPCNDEIDEDACDCDGNVLDDCGACNGGNASMDECGVCAGSGPEEGFNCDGIPLDFVYNQSAEQAFYHIFSAYDLDGNPLITGEDWIGVFNGDVCVGAREWTFDVSTDVPAMGDDGYWHSIGYLQEGDIPNFKIFDVSENLFYSAQPSEEYPFSNNGVFSVESLSAGINYTLSLENHHNLVSFYALPDDASIGGITSSLGNNALSVITEGSSAINFDGIWSGSLTEITPENGYWISINDSPDSISVIGFDMDPGRLYELHEGPNLISFPDSGSADLSSAIPDDVEHLFIAIISEGISALNSDNGWAGSLTGFQGGSGYWVIVQEDLSFSYNIEDLLARSVHTFLENLPDEEGFNVVQSSRQAFYFIDDIKLNKGGIEDGDWILSYNNDVLAGIRQWNGNTIDIPSMGSVGDLVTAGYFNEGDIPTFKLLKQSTGKIILLEGSIPNWSDNGIYSIGELFEKQPIPELFVLNKAYPNPFNPTTTIGFALPNTSEVLVEIYNLYGKRVETLVNKSMQAGYKSVIWNADYYSSGLYFIRLTAQSSNGFTYSSTQKLMLMK